MIPANFNGRPGDRIYVTWMRAEERSAWMNAADAHDEKPSLVESVGFLLNLANGGLVLCAQRDEDNGVVNGVVTIPVGAIVDGPFVLTHRQAE